MDDVAIVGAGLAGLTLAAALRQAGVPVRVWEQTRTFGTVGAGIQLAPNATRLLHRLGLRDRLRDTAVRPSAIEMRRWDDDAVIARTELGTACERQFGAPYLTVHRADLHEALLGLLPPGTVRPASRCVSVTENDHGATLHFEDGTTDTATLVAGADGIHSAVREGLATDRPRFSGQTIHRALVPAGRVPELLVDPKVVLWLGPDQHAVSYPVAGGRLVSFGATMPAATWRTESWTAAGSPGDLAAAYDGWHPQVRRLIDGVDTVSRWALHDRDPVPHWSGRHVTLVGDAAHPMLPFVAQGANQAIEDAIILARCLTETDLSIPEALQRYEQLRRERVDRVHGLSRGNATTFHVDDGAGRRERDDTLAAERRLQEQAWLYGYDAAELPIR
ncbi:FAD-dependent monooxygenase [Actinoplanes rectilineatus]|uniref:FAD-dependent monooxygenase n=1 Tax=Actinoplanes rectilineatus TaxID=113571 RepID=UPI0005F2F179|nr:FAD-dependent monooxygenase [Actinoplanes rectilineatus]